MTVGNGRQHELAQTLSAVARQLQAEASVSEVLASMTSSAVQSISGADYAGITLVQNGGKTVAAEAGTHEVIQHCDALQSELGEGPCLDAVWQQHTVMIPDMSVETRWPRFAAEAQRLGVGSMMSFQLYVERDNLGALNLYGVAPYSFAQDAQLVGELFASHAAVALAGASESRQLNEALTTRDTIGQAKGILMHRDHVDGPTAFATLVQTSQQTNIKLAEVASWLVNEHNHPGEAHRPAAGENR